MVNGVKISTSVELHILYGLEGDVGGGALLQGDLPHGQGGGVGWEGGAWTAQVQQPVSL